MFVRKHPLQMPEGAADMLSSADGGAPPPDDPTGSPADSDDQTPPPAPPSEAPWYGEIDENTAAYIQNKGWDGVEKAIESYRNLEKKVGANTVALLGEDATPEEQEAFYKALGRPDKPEDYELPLPEGAEVEDPVTATFIRTAGHKHGLTAAQVKGLAADWNEYTAELGEQSAVDFEAKTDAELKELRREMGNGYDSFVQAGKQGVKALGVDKDQLNRIERAIGAGAMMRLFGKVGETLGEAGAISGSGGTGGGATPAALERLSPAMAQARYDDLMADESFRTKYLDGDAKAMEKVNALRRAMVAGGSV